MGIFQDFIDLTRWTSVDFGPPNTKEDLANDMDLTGLQYCQSTDGLWNKMEKKNTSYLIA